MKNTSILKLFAILLFGALCSFSNVLGQSNNITIQEANTFYDEGSYAAAIMALNMVDPVSVREADEVRLLRGLSLISLKKYEKGIEELKLVDALYESRNVPLHLGVAKYQLGQYAQAIEQLNISLGLNSTNDTVYYFLGMSQYHLRDYPDALVNLQMAKVFNKNRQDIHKYLGICEYYYELYVDGIYSLQTSLVLDSLDVEAYNYLGMCYYNLDRIDLAIYNMKRSLVLGTPEAAETAINLSLIFEELDEVDSSLYYLEKAISLDSTRIEAYYFAGNIYYNQQNYEKSTSYYQALLNINPKYRSAYKQLANSLFFEGKYEEAIDKYRKSTYFEEKGVETINLMGVSYMRKGEYEIAQQYFEEAILLNPEYGLAFYNMAWIAFHEEKYEDAISYLSYANKTLKNDADVHFLFAKVYLQLQMLEEAEFYLGESIRFEPLRENHYLYMGHLCLLKNEKKRAEFYYNILLTLDPTNAEAHYYNATIQYNKQNYSAALSHLDKAEAHSEEVAEKLLMNKSMSYIKIKDYNNALSYLQKLSKQTPEDPKVYYMLSLAYKGLHDKLLGDYYENMAMRMDPKMADFIF